MVRLTGAFTNAKMRIHKKLVMVPLIDLKSLLAPPGLTKTYSDIKRIIKTQAQLDRARFES